MSGTTRQEAFDHAGPSDATVEIDAGRVEVVLAAPDAALGGDGVVVELEALGAPDPDGEAVSGGSDTFRGIGVAGFVDAAGALDRRFGLGLGGIPGFGERLGESPQERAERAVAETEVSFAGGRLLVRRPDDLVLRTVPLAVTVHAPDGTAVSVSAGAAPVDVRGRPGEVDVRTTGAVALEETTARSSVRCGAGTVTIGRVGAVLRVRGGSGKITVDDVAGATEIVTGSGAVTVGTVAADLAVRTGAGGVTVRDAWSGDLDLSTGAGSVRVGVHAGTDASVDLRSATGNARSELPVSGSRPEGSSETSPALRIRGRTKAGSTRVVSAAAV